MLIFTLMIRGYILIGLVFFAHCLKIFLKDQSTPKTDTSSWIVLGLATLLWPITLPLSYLEREANGHRSDRYTHVEEIQLNKPTVQYRLSAPPLVERQNPQLSASPSDNKYFNNTNNIA
ncbi:hypothetical protein VB834_12020 [Limnoraphis robusta Tam1]|uniref:Uncharacterized protein n=1 Tax=Limnoraphis robusta CCNP1315 TaxID=3110306 RepID=A0ABU5U6D7_9CYAN|nr:hypothetical protein [Limnoraphis robusta]MEA5496532.1 hypothetical protein [Limnoraphis robusta BA-68 BA1]MEA5522555.1 hypothetical protein [Limnoraphis robusta CCNP1315]MEA5539757.1 hypothetical protein [Limnoraphis robusta Tam1]MEA5545063.1 hypothetical protein [Limnoraphis robusta CCNP1324]